MPSIGNVWSIGVSGELWIGTAEKPNFDLVMKMLEGAKSNIRIATYAVGCESQELKAFFDLLEKKVTPPVKKPIQFIINRLNDEKTNSEYAREILSKLDSFEDFTLVNYEPKDKKKNLHAKIFLNFH